jgi:hypothetical protein
MLIKTQEHAPIVSCPTATQPLGPLPRRPQRLFDTSASFAGVYLRPNLASGGTVPASGPLCASPDIWIANHAPVANAQQALASSERYACGSNSHVEHGMANYLYIRGYNNTASTKSARVSLHYAPAGVIQWPGLWQHNVLLTSRGDTAASLVVPSQSVGVIDTPFVWDNPPPPPPGSDHYGLFARLDAASHPTAFPEVTRALDMAALVTQHLGWGWKNTTYVPAPTGVSFAYSTMLSVPANVVAPGHTFLLWIAPRRYAGWSVQFSCNQTDSDGKPFTLGPRPIPITADGQIIGLMVTLEPGFHALVSVTLHSNGHSQQPGASLPLMCSYQASGTHAEEAYARGLVDPVFMRAINDGLRGTRQHPGITPTAFVGLGGYTWAHPAQP